MPGGDGTGPLGMGPMTGRGAGFCVGYAYPGYRTPAWWGRGYLGWRRGRGGWGFGGWYGAGGWPGWGSGLRYPLPYYAVSAPSRLEPPVEEETRALKNQVKYYEDALRSTQAFIKELMEETKQE